MKTISPTYLFLQTLYEAVTSHFPATLDFFRPQHSFRPQNTLAHPQDHPKKVHPLPKFLERFLTRSLLIWIFFLVSIQPRGLFLSCCHLHFFNDAVGTATKAKKTLEPDFCAQMSWWKSVTSHTIQTIHTMHHHHHRHHDCFIFDIAEMSALPPSP